MQRVEVTGSCLLLNSLITSYFSIFCLVLRAVNVPSIRKYLIKNRIFFVTVSNPETTSKTADVPVERQMAKWNQILDPLYVFPPSLQFMAKTFHPVLYNRLRVSLFAFMQSDPHIPTSL